MKVHNIQITSENTAEAIAEEPIVEAVNRPEPKLQATDPVDDNQLEDIFSKMFQSSVSGTGEEELLRIASTYSRQIHAKQIKILLYLEYRAFTSKSHTTKKVLKSFVDRWLELKQYNNSDAFVMKALEFISLRKFLNENSLKVNIDK